MSSNTVANGLNAKIDTIEMMADEGFCYLKLCIMLKNFKECSVDHFFEALSKLKSNCGPFPTCSGVFLELGIMDARLDNLKNGHDLNAEEFTFNKHVYAEMMENRCRFSVDDRGSSFHIGAYMVDECFHQDAICNHGWSSKMTVVALAGKDKKIGGTVVDLNDLFGDGEFSDLTMTPTEILGNNLLEPPLIERYKLGQSIVSQQETIDRLSREISENVGESLNKKQEPRLKAQMNRLSENELMEKLLDRMSKIEQKLSSQSNEGESCAVYSGEELDPSDSRSNLTVANKRYMNQGTILTSQKDGRMKLSKIIEVPNLEPSCQVVMGFVKTPEMESKEDKIRQSIRPINGLAKPFCDNRLNLLLHFNTAVVTNMPIESTSGYATSLIKILSRKPRTPSEQLTKLIISRTFDFEDRTVIANPFKLPYIEVGMMISDNCLAACFTLLDDELRRLWFDNMKSLIVPSFHGKFSNFSESTLNGAPGSVSRSHTKKSRSSSSSSSISHASKSSGSSRSTRWF
jgi:hypothetical protein